MTVGTLVRQLEACLQEEKGVQGRLLALLEAQEKAALAGDGDALVITGDDLERELAGETTRERRRRELLAGFAAAFGVPARILTLSSIVERLGSEGERLGRLRAELRETLLAVRGKSKRVAVIARGHQDVLRDVLRVLLGDSSETGGVLVDAEA